MSMAADVSTDRCINIPRKYSGKILNHFFTKWIARQNLKLNFKSWILRENSVPKCSKRLTYNRKAPGSVPLGQLDEFICFLIASCSTYRSQSTSGHKQF